MYCILLYSIAYYMYCIRFGFPQIMQPAQSDEHAHIASHVTPGHALTNSHPPFFLNPEALNFAALDYLTDFITKVGKN